MITRDDIKFKTEEDEDGNITIIGELRLTHSFRIDKHCQLPGSRDHAKETILRSIRNKIYGDQEKRAREIHHNIFKLMDDPPYRSYENIQNLMVPFVNLGQEITDES